LKEIGEFLKSAREEKGISLDDISNSTKIPKRYLRSLEEGDFSCFSGEVYLKGALRHYADAVGLNPREIISGYELLLKKEKKYENEKRGQRTHTKRIEDNRPVVARNKKKIFPPAALIWITLLAIVVVGSLWYLSQQPPGENAGIPYAGEPAPEENGGDDNNFDLPEEELFPEPEEPEIAIVSSSSNEIVYTLSKAEEKQVHLAFSGRCWVRIEQDGTLIEEATYVNGDTKQLSDALETRIRLGCPSVVKIGINGIELEDLKGIGNPINIIVRKAN
jgi:cytoskeletal protein RodZ